MSSGRIVHICESDTNSKVGEKGTAGDHCDYVARPKSLPMWGA